MTTSSRILIVDDDYDLCDLLADYLRNEGFIVDVAHDGDAALTHIQRQAVRPDLLILDVMMPRRDGIETLKQLRMQYRLPVIMMSARGEPVDRILGLELGADDYLAKPVLPRELLARVRVQLRRIAPGTAGMLLVGLLRLLPAERRAFVAEAEMALSGSEFMLLQTLAQRAGELVDKATLSRVALGRDLGRFDRGIDMQISRLRHKLSNASDEAPRIDAVRGAGYVLIAGAQ